MVGADRGIESYAGEETRKFNAGIEGRLTGAGLGMARGGNIGG